MNDTVASEKMFTGCAVTLYVPAMQFDVQLTAATPLASVTAKELEKMHDAARGEVDAHAGGGIAGGVEDRRTNH